MATLPIGKQPLSVIETMTDLPSKLGELGKLFEYLLWTSAPDFRGTGEQTGRGERVTHQAHVFSNIRDVRYALGVRNDLEHVPTDRPPDRPEPKMEDVERACRHLTKAIGELLPHVPADVARAATGGSGRPNLIGRGAAAKKPQGFFGSLFRTVRLVACLVVGFYIVRFFVRSSESQSTRALVEPRTEVTAVPDPTPFDSESDVRPGATRPIVGVPSTSMDRYGKESGYRVLPAADPAEEGLSPGGQLEVETAASIRRTQLALAKTKQQQMSFLGEEVTRALAEWDKAARDFAAETNALLEGDSGRGLTGDPQLVRRFQAVCEKERPSPGEVTRVRSQAETLLVTVKAALSNPKDAWVPDEALSAQLTEFLTQAKAGRDAHRAAREQIGSLVSHAKRYGKPGKLSLRDAMREEAEQRAIAQADSIEAEVRRAREQATRRVAAAKTEEVREAAVREEAVVKARTQVMMKQKERERLITYAGSPAVQAQFAPFLSRGKFSFNGGPRSYSSMSDRPAPASFGRLVSLGWLKDVETFAGTMAGLDSSMDRPKMPYPRSEADWKRMEQLLEQFKLLGPIWVEQGKLLP